MKKIFTILIASVTILYSCRKEKLSLPTGLVYGTKSYTTNYKTDGSSVSPSVNWNGNGGTDNWASFNILSVTNSCYLSGAIKKQAFTGSNGATPAPGIRINETTGVITWDTTTFPGEYQIRVIATNAVGSSNIDTITLIVQGVSYASTAFNGTGSSSTFSANNGTKGEIIAHAYYPNALPLGTFSLAVTPTPSTGSITIHPTSGNVLWTANVPVGVYEINISNSNNTNLSTKIVLKVAAASATNTNTISYATSSITSMFGSSGGDKNQTTTSGIYEITGVNITSIYNATKYTTQIPTGISINTTTGDISWNRDLTEGIYAIFVKNGSVSSTKTANLTITVPGFFYNLVVANNKSEYTSSADGVGNSITPTIGNIPANGKFYFSTITKSNATINPRSIEKQISIDATTGIIKWSGIIATGTYTLTIKNTNAQTTVTYTLTVK